MEIVWRKVALEDLDEAGLKKETGGWN